MESLSEAQFTANVYQWALDRNLINGSTPDRQFLKLAEELGEIDEAESKHELQDAVGDVAVVLEIIIAQIGSPGGVPVFSSASAARTLTAAAGRMAKAISKEDVEAVLHFAGSMKRSLEDFALMHDLDIAECRAQAWNEIKDRRGRMVNGVFVKEAG